MGTTVNYQIPYPGVNEAPDGPFSFQAGAEATDAAIKGQSDRLDKLPVRIVSGTATLNVTSGIASISSFVNFGTTFAAAPLVSVSCSTNAVRASVYSGYGSTTTGFTAKVQTADGATYGSAFALTLNWTAVGA